MRFCFLGLLALGLPTPAFSTDRPPATKAPPASLPSRYSGLPSPHYLEAHPPQYFPADPPFAPRSTRARLLEAAICPQYVLAELFRARVLPALIGKKQD
jgi:hypothetical protein